jgi:hypothetical protein
MNTAPPANFFLAGGVAVEIISKQKISAQEQVHVCLAVRVYLR